VIISNITCPCNVLHRIKAPASSASLPVSWTLLVLLVRNSVFLSRKISEQYFQPWLFSKANRRWSSWLIFFADIAVLQHFVLISSICIWHFVEFIFGKYLAWLKLIIFLIGHTHLSLINKLFHQCWKLTNLWYNFFCSKSFYQHPGEDSLKWYPWFWLQLSFACSLEVVNRKRLICPHG
jgi:hypothetical protein